MLSLPIIEPAFKVEETHCNGFGRARLNSSLNARENKLVCVTSGNFYLGSRIVKNLLANGYLVPVTIQNQVDFEEMNCLMNEEEIYKLESIVAVRMQDLDSLRAAFCGCRAIFHTGSFIDPHGVSSYSVHMVFLEAEVAKNVIEACSKAAYVRCNRLINS